MRYHAVRLIGAWSCKMPALLAQLCRNFGRRPRRCTAFVVSMSHFTPENDRSALCLSPSARRAFSHRDVADNLVVVHGIEKADLMNLETEKRTHL